ncbi:MAG TPA: insulinase family protein [Crocinitomix sp.]|nr:insulinase family protein [Crocinitomix sp.]
MKFKLWLIGSLFLTTSLMAQQKKVEFVEYDLDNGMHVILHQDQSTPVVAVTLMYHVGSKNENVGRTGFAHFFEHLMFEGTQNIPRHEYDKYVERAGGTLNANTSQDRTFYYELLPSNQLEMGLWLESERLLHAKVDQVGIETQREVVKEEKRQRVDNQPYGTFMENIFKRVYSKHPYRWVPIGSMEDLDAAQEEDYVNFYRTFYVPHNVTLSIAGDIDIEQSKIWIDNYFGTIPNGDKLNVYRDKEFLDLAHFAKKYNKEVGAIAQSKNFVGDWNNLSTEDFIKKYFKNISSKPHPIPRPDVKEGLLNKEIKDTIYDNIQLPAIIMAYKTPELNHKDHYAVEMLAMLLSQGNSSRFNKSIVEKQRLAMMAVAFPFPLEDEGIALSFALANVGVDLKDLQEALDKEIEIVQQNLISDEELQKLKNQIESDFISSNSTMAGIAEQLAQYYIYYQGNTNLINTEIQKYLSVTKEDIKRVANKYFANNNRVILYYLPKENN